MVPETDSTSGPSAPVNSSTQREVGPVVEEVVIPAVRNLDSTKRKRLLEIIDKVRACYSNDFYCAPSARWCPLVAGTLIMLLNPDNKKRVAPRVLLPGTSVGSVLEELHSAILQPESTSSLEVGEVRVPAVEKPGQAEQATLLDVIDKVRGAHPRGGGLWWPER